MHKGAADRVWPNGNRAAAQVISGPTARQILTTEFHGSSVCFGTLMDMFCRECTIQFLNIGVSNLRQFRKRNKLKNIPIRDVRHCVVLAAGIQSHILLV